MSERAEAAFEAWWASTTASQTRALLRLMGPRQGFLAGHAARDGEVEALLRFGGRPIPCSERMPEDDAMVLAFFGRWANAVYDSRLERWYSDAGRINAVVTHWLALPPAPESRTP